MADRRRLRYPAMIWFVIITDDFLLVDPLPLRIIPPKAINPLYLEAL
jgi:hypothetical protein